MSDGFLGHPAGPAIAGIESLLVAAVLFGFGFLLVSALDPRHRLDFVERCATAFPAVVGFSLVLMLLHLVTGGWALSSRWFVIPLSAAVIALCGIRVRRLPKQDRDEQRWPAAVVAAVTVVIWAPPVFALLPLFAGGDPGLHAGWTNQLLGGELLPTIPIPGEAPNYYPWLYHGLSALVTHLTPGANPYLAQGPLQVLQPIALSLGFLALGRRLFGSTLGGLAAALFGGLAGGIGWLWSRGPEILMDPRAPGAAVAYAGDLLFVRGPAIAFSSLAPVFPRDVALTLLVPTILLVFMGLERRDRPLLVAGGTVLGLVGLVGAEPFFVGVPLAAALAFVLSERGERALNLLSTVGIAVLLYCLWAVPILVNYVRLDGFVNTSEIPPVELPWYGFLGAWGVAVPFAILGVVAVTRRALQRAVTALLLLAVAVPSIAFMAAGLIPKVMGEGFTVLGRSHRYWPLLSLGISLLAAGGLWSLASLASARRSKALAATTAVIATVSPVFVSLAFVDEVPRVAVLQAALEGDDGTLFETLKRAGPGCTVAGYAQSALAFAYTGDRQLDYEWRPNRQNDARIRWKRSLEQLPSDTERSIANAQIADGTATEEVWRAAVERFGVDIVITEPAFGDAPRFAGKEPVEVRGAEQTFVLFHLRRCG